MSQQKIPPPPRGHNWPMPEVRAPSPADPFFKFFKSEVELDAWEAANQPQLEDLERRNATRDEAEKAERAAWGEALRAAAARSHYRLPRSIAPTIEALARLALADPRRPLPASFLSIARLTGERFLDISGTWTDPRPLSVVSVRTALRTMVGCDLLRAVPPGKSGGVYAFDHGPAVIWSM